MKLNEVKDLFPKFDVDTFEHVLGHVSKAAGKLHGLVGDADHIQEARDIDRDLAFEVAEDTNGKRASAYIADLVIYAAKLAVLCPSGEVDMEKVVADRMNEKRAYRAQYAGK
jgi:hypothetical protein